MGGINVTDVTREIIPLLWSRVRERAFIREMFPLLWSRAVRELEERWLKVFSFKMGSAKYSCVCKRRTINCG